MAKKRSTQRTAPTKCPHCKRKFVDINKHMKGCKRNPKNMPPVITKAVCTNSPLDLSGATDKDLKGVELWEVCPPMPGSHYAFKSAQELWDKAMTYMRWAKMNPVESIDYKGGAAKPVTYRKKRPLTIYGLCCFTGMTEDYFRNIRHTAPEMPELQAFGSDEGYQKALNKYKLHHELITVYTRIRQMYSSYNADLATSGDVKEGIIARLEGWGDKQEIEAKVVQQQVFTLNISKPNLDR